jgi:hypothetical protein
MKCSDELWKNKHKYVQINKQCQNNAQRSLAAWGLKAVYAQVTGSGWVMLQGTGAAGLVKADDVMTGFVGPIPYGCRIVQTRPQPNNNV